MIPNTIPPIGLNKNAIANAANVKFVGFEDYVLEKKFAPMYAVV